MQNIHKFYFFNSDLLVATAVTTEQPRIESTEPPDLVTRTHRHQPGSGSALPRASITVAHTRSTKILNDTSLVAESLRIFERLLLERRLSPRKPPADDRKASTHLK